MNKQIKFEWIVVGVILIISLYLSFNREKEIKNIEENKGEVIATIINCSSTVHDPFKILIEYKYMVDNETYYSRENSFETKFSKCVETKNCIGKRYSLYYNKSNPEESKIDFDDEK